MRGHGLVGVALLVAACVPATDDTTALISEPRILALRGVPAEAKPNTPVRYEALIAHPTADQGAEPRYSFCTKSRSAEERTGVSRECLDGEGLIEVETIVPANACALFGPNTPPSEPGEPARRPSDPDPSGGYFIPVLAEDLSGEAPPSFGFQRIRCDLAGATREIFEQYQARYRENLHPSISLLRAGATELRSVEQNALPAGPLALRIEVRADSFEPFVVYSANDSALYDQVEALRVHWYASAGEFSASESAVEQNSRSATVTWTGPEAGGAARLWVVVRDSRGGSDWAEFEVTRASAR